HEGLCHEVLRGTFAPHLKWVSKENMHESKDVHFELHLNLEFSPLKRLDTMASRRSQIEEFEPTFKEQFEGFTTKAYLQEDAAINRWGKEFYQQDPNIALIHSTPVVYIFTLDDIGVASLYTASVADLICITPEAQSTPKLEPFIYFSPL
ncbi:3-oxoacyl-[acyl-carrier-protein] synthase, partial [Massospora cicadina]